jgi:hypothetical protein
MVDSLTCPIRLIVGAINLVGFIFYGDHKMNVSELIEELKKLDQNLPVVFPDYGAGELLVSDSSERIITVWKDDHWGGIKVVFLNSAGSI